MCVCVSGVCVCELLYFPGSGLGDFLKSNACSDGEMKAILTLLQTTLNRLRCVRGVRCVCVCVCVCVSVC